MRVLLLGPVELCAEGGAVVPIGSAKRRAVLAGLALEFNRTVPVGRLMRLAWEGTPPPRARQALQGHVAALRKLLGGGLELQTRDNGYRLTGAADQVDLYRFEELAGRAAHTDDPRIKAGLLRDALALWRGCPLTDLPAGERRETAARSLQEQHLGVLESWAEVELALGRGGETIPSLDQSVRADGLRESLVRVLMLCLRQDGRQAEALELYHRTRERLLLELGVEPGSGLREAFEQVLRAAPPVPSAQPARAAVPSAPVLSTAPDSAPATPPEPVGPPAAAGAPAGPALPLTPRQLPRAGGGFVGREEDWHWLDRVREADPEEPALAVVVGPAGVGKTALVVRWAHHAAGHYPDGQLFADLRGYDTRSPERPENVLGGFLHALGVPAAEIPADGADRSALFAELTRTRRLLLVLDNAREAADVRPLLPTGAGCATVVTSRSALAELIAREGGAWRSLDRPGPRDALALLAAAIGPARVAAEPEQAARLVELCDRLPLAVRLAGARLAARPGWRIAHLVQEITEQQAYPDGPEHPGGAGVTAALTLSSRLLPESAARLLSLLGAHPGAEIDLLGGAALLGCPAEEARRTFGRLAGAHLIGEPHPGRYRRDALVAQYCRRQLAERYGPAERAAATARLTDYHLTAVATAVDRLTPYPWLLSRHREHRPLDLPAMATNAAGLAWFREQEPVIRALVEETTARGDHDRAWRLAENCSTAYYTHPDFLGRWRTVAEAGLRAAERAGDSEGVWRLRRVLGLALVKAQEWAAGLAELERAAADAAAAGGGWRRRLPTALTLGEGLLDAGQPGRARPLLQEAARLAEAADRPRTEATASHHLAATLLALGEPGTALEHARRGLALLAGGSKPDLVWMLTIQARALHALGRLEEALVSARRSLDLSDRHGPAAGEADIRRLLARLLAALGRREEAAGHLARAALLLETSRSETALEVRRELGLLIGLGRPR
ncbi:AfsR/SARP family transcriptional regulator [Kitasatospora sp. NPDC093550]|uniref:AfsR/SARP family transcriptional regulator n=1 Tax=Kitasatospora sp. NPDC093550 TaxID=3364089 RepID=UPI0038220C30